MLNFLKKSIFLLNFFTLLFVPSLSDHPTELFASCLTRRNIKNFTAYHPGLENKSTYFKLLNFSIYNLRYAQPTVPKPAAIILPESKDQLANTVVCVREAAWGIRLRGGGHSYEGTSSVATDGAPFVVVDMMNLDQVSVDLDSKTAWVEGGATLGQTYYAIAKSSELYGFSAGSCPTVGIGGHIAGGGFGLLSRKYGLAADNVEDALLVDANGQLIDRQGMGEDVFWAIRGGGGGIWGIVYAWKIKLLQVPQIVTGFIVSRPGSKHQVAKLVNKWQHVAPKLTGGFYLSAFVGAGLPERKTIGISATFKGFFLGPMSESLAIINEVFPELSLVEQECKEMSWIESILYFSGLDSGSSVANLKDRFMHDKHYFKAKSDYVRNITPISGILSALDILEKEPKGYVILDPYGGVMQNISSEAIAFPHRKDNLYTIQYLVEWKESDNARSDEYIEWIREFYNSMAPYVSRGPRAAYVNYIDLDLGIMELLRTSAPTADAVEMARAWGEKYFLKNYDRLVKAKTSIDPYNIFRHQQGIPPDSMGCHSLKAGFDR